MNADFWPLPVLRLSYRPGQSLNPELTKATDAHLKLLACSTVGGMSRQPDKADPANWGAPSPSS